MFCPITKSFPGNLKKFGLSHKGFLDTPSVVLCHRIRKQKGLKCTAAFQIGFTKEKEWIEKLTRYHHMLNKQNKIAHRIHTGNFCYTAFFYVHF